MKLGYSTWGMPTVPVEVALDHLAALGFDGVELTVIPGYTTELGRLDATERRRIRALLDRHGLDLPALAAHVDLLAADPATVATNMDRLRLAVDLAVDLAGPEGPPAVTTTAGGQPGQGDQLWPLLVQRVSELGRYGAERGVVIGIEGHVASMVERPAELRRLVDEIGSPFVRANFDISHFNVLGMAIEESVPIMAPVAVHTHVKDERGRVPDFQFLIPGEGEFDYARYLRAMRAAGYDGYITVEVSMMVQRRPDYDPLAAASQSYAVLDAAFHKAEITRTGGRGRD